MKKSFQFWWEIWIQVIVILLQLYILQSYVIGTSSADLMMLKFECISPHSFLLLLGIQWYSASDIDWVV